MVKPSTSKAQKKALEPVTRDYTVNLHRLCHKTQFKKKGPRALSEIRKFAQKAMLTEDVRIDPEVNSFVWAKGIRTPPRRVRVRLSRRKNEEETKGKEQFYTNVKLIRVESFAKLQTEKSREDK